MIFLHMASELFNQIAFQMHKTAAGFTLHVIAACRFLFADVLKACRRTVGKYVPLDLSFFHQLIELAVDG